MKIAVPTRNNMVDSHFGHCEYYTVFTIDDGKTISGSEILESPRGCGCKSDIASVLRDQGVSLMLAGNMGQGAVNKLNSFGIDIIRGCGGDVNDLVMDYLADKVSDSGNSCAQHERHQHGGHDCKH